ncbi:hypothetical protein DAPPUDRAFT_245327 [Daphnia pulex]|uniref:Uncharacterized protein n=1 Tax=Daphnia pulex TaxID=6669 RepID=E9GN38_DAPPU|nr:hypothetical protein DAPPUDRAFT_245327 [Daphnia pulex]|eukprot:EFX79101.1 hypothetical protein DAPPUDRAFT_245327 [Daphnia pulex]
MDREKLRKWQQTAEACPEFRESKPRSAQIRDEMFVFFPCPVEFSMYADEEDLPLAFVRVDKMASKREKWQTQKNRMLTSIHPQNEEEEEDESEFGYGSVSRHRHRKKPVTLNGWRSPQDTGHHTRATTNEFSYTIVHQTHKDFWFSKNYLTLQPVESPARLGCIIRLITVTNLYAPPRMVNCAKIQSIIPSSSSKKKFQHEMPGINC